MKNPFDHPAWVDISLLLGRVSLGLYFALAGFAKFKNFGLTGFAGSGAFKGLTPSWLPQWFAAPYGYLLPPMELICGVLLMIGLFTRVAAGLITLMLLSIAIALIFAHGLAGQPADAKGGAFHHSFVMFGLALILAIFGSGRLALDPLYFGGGGGGRGSKAAKTAE